VFPDVARCCRIGLDTLISLLSVARRGCDRGQGHVAAGAKQLELPGGRPGWALWYEGREVLRGGGVGVGDRVRVDGEISLPEPGEDDFDYAKYLEAAPIGAQRVCVEGEHGMLDHLGSCLSFPMKEPIRARHPTIHHRANLGTVLCPSAGAKDKPSAWLSPSSDTG
jgi:hypothetical protein